MKNRFILILFIFFITAALYAQSAGDELEAFLTVKTISWGQAARFVLQAADVINLSDTEEAFWYAATRKWLPLDADPDDKARMDGIALLLMKAFNLQGGVMYNITGNQHYAFRELIYRGVIQNRMDRYQFLSGEQLVFYTSRILAEREIEEEEAAKFAEERTAREKKAHLVPESFDFGLLFNQYSAAIIFPQEDDDSEKAFEYKAGLTPRVSFLLGDIGTFFISCNLSIGFNNDFYFIHELLRTDVFFRFSDYGIRVGRFFYSDPLKFVANSLLDGSQFTYNSNIGRFDFGAWFTGILYKKNATILMTDYDRMVFNAPYEKDNYWESYFAPPRWLMAIDWEHPSIGNFMQLNASLAMQLDATGVPLADSLHSQYFLLKASIPAGSFLFTIGGVLETYIGITGSDIASAKLAVSRPVAIAGELGVYYKLPGKHDGTVSFLVNYASGDNRFLSESIRIPFGGYVPVTARFFGDIFQTEMAGFTIFSLNYSGYFNRIFGAKFAATYFIRDGANTQVGSLLGDPGLGERNLGAEISAHLIVTPFSDVQYKIGIGAFLPSLGDNWTNAQPVWRIDLSTVFGLY